MQLYVAGEFLTPHCINTNNDWCWYFAEEQKMLVYNERTIKTVPVIIHDHRSLTPEEHQHLSRQQNEWQRANGSWKRDQERWLKSTGKYSDINVNDAVPKPKIENFPLVKKLEDNHDKEVCKYCLKNFEEPSYLNESYKGLKSKRFHLSRAWIDSLESINYSLPELAKKLYYAN